MNEPWSPYSTQIDKSDDTDSCNLTREVVWTSNGSGIQPRGVLRFLFEFGSHFSQTRELYSYQSTKKYKDDCHRCFSFKRFTLGTLHSTFHIPKILTDSFSIISLLKLIGQYPGSAQKTWSVSSSRTENLFFTTFTVSITVEKIFVCLHKLFDTMTLTILFTISKKYFLVKDLCSSNDFLPRYFQP